MAETTAETTTDFIAGTEPMLRSLYQALALALSKDINEATNNEENRLTIQALCKQRIEADEHESLRPPPSGAALPAVDEISPLTAMRWYVTVDTIDDKDESGAMESWIQGLPHFGTACVRTAT